MFIIHKHLIINSSQVQKALYKYCHLYNYLNLRSKMKIRFELIFLTLKL
jgi:hypothetical protein